MPSSSALVGSIGVAVGIIPFLFWLAVILGVIGLIFGFTGRGRGGPVDRRPGDPPRGGRGPGRRGRRGNRKHRFASDREPCFPPGRDVPATAGRGNRDQGGRR